MSLLLFVSILVSFMYIWSATYIMQPFRNLINYVPILKWSNICPSCTTWWIALILSIMINPLDGILPPLLSNIAVAAISFVAMEITIALTKGKCNGGCSGSK